MGLRWLVVPVGVFVVALGVSWAYYSFDHVSRDAPGAERPERVAAGEERIAVAIRGRREGQSYVYVVGLDGSGLERLTFPPPDVASVDDGFTSWSPDGRTIVVVRQLVADPSNPSHPQLYSLSPDGTGLRRLSKGNAFDFLPSWSPDSSLIVFARLVDEQSTDLFTMRPDGSRVTQLTSDPRVYEDMASFSPDGERIAYTRVADGNEDVWIMRTDGSGARPLLSGPQQDSSPAFSPDGKTLAFVRDGHIGFAASDGSGARVLTEGELKDSGPKWSPDGTRILFTRDPGEIYVMQADGSHLARVPLEGQAGGASWGPAP